MSALQGPASELLEQVAQGQFGKDRGVPGELKGAQRPKRRQGVNAVVVLEPDEESVSGAAAKGAMR